MQEIYEIIIYMFTNKTLCKLVVNINLETHLRTTKVVRDKNYIFDYESITEISKNV